MESKSKLNRIRNHKMITHCYILKDGMYYKPGHCGYTDFVTRAGVYPKDEAILSAEKCKELYLIPVINEEHNAGIIKEVQDLLTRYIP